jgi:hypothetical protein
MILLVNGTPLERFVHTQIDKIKVCVCGVGGYIKKLKWM